MTDEAKWLLERAEESLEAAELTLRNELYHSAVSEGYYVRSYAAQALILSKGENASTHKGVLTQFSLLFIKTSEIDRRFGTMISNAFAARGKADYEIGLDISDVEAMRVVANAKAFFEMTKEKLQP